MTARLTLRLLVAVIILPGMIGAILPAQNGVATIPAQRDKLFEDFSTGGDFSQLPQPEPEAYSFWVVRAYYQDRQMVSTLAQWIEPWEVHHDQGYLVVGVTQTELDLLQQLGFEVVIDTRLTELYNRPLQSLPEQISGIPGYDCYRTVEETYAEAQSLSSAYPSLAKWIDIGDSWEKFASGGSEGYDLMVLRLTNSALPGPKPKLFLMASLHAREYAPAELATRFARYLLEQYGLDPDVTYILDTHEIHLLLHANPDGRKQAETGILWRKNTNENYCSPTSTYRGADLNRNFDFEWGCCNGSSTYECDTTYRGPSPASEPETQAIQSYVRSLFPDQRGPLITDPAPATASGLFLDIHSYGELVLWPWGFTEAAAPNAIQLQTLGRKLAYFNDYAPSQAIDLYPIDGASDDFTYGDLGVAAYTIELGTSFFETCNYFDYQIVPKNFPALMYAVKIAGQPYILPSGPEILSLTALETGVQLGSPVQISATADDTRFSSANGIEPSQVIIAAEYYIDIPPDDPSRLPLSHPMSAADGSFNAGVEVVSAAVSTIGLAPGRHNIYVRAKDSSGNWGPVSAGFFYLFDPNSAATLKGYVREAGSLQPLSASIQVGPFHTTSHPITGYYALQTMEGTYPVEFSSPGHSRSLIPALNLDALQVVNQDVELFPECAILWDDVESGQQAWTYQSPWAISTEAYNSPVHAWTDSPGKDYANNLNISLTSPILDLSQFVAPRLSFWHIFDLEPGFDFGVLGYSLDGGTNWARINTFTGNQGSWRAEEFSLPQFQGQSLARFRFRLTTDSSVTSDGWHIDDIHLVAGSLACQENQVPVAAFSSTSPQLPGQPVQFTNLSYGYPAISYSWDFGDGTASSAEREPWHIYPSIGDYNVSLTVNNLLGSHTIQQPVVITHYAVQLVSPVSYLSGAPGVRLSYPIQVTNSGLVPDTYQFSLNHIWPANLVTLDGVSLPGNAISLEVGESAAILLQVDIPSDLVAGAMDTAQVNLVSLGDSRVRDSFQVVSQVDWWKIWLAGIVKE